MKGWPGEPDMDYDVLVADGEAAANAGKPITDVIFDFGNVLIYWDPRVGPEQLGIQSVPRGRGTVRYSAAA